MRNESVNTSSSSVLNMAGMDKYSRQYPEQYEIKTEGVYSRSDIVNLGKDIKRPIPAVEEPPLETDISKYVGIGVSIASIITENLLSHPFVVLRRQCQVHNNSYRYHLVPFTLVPVIVHLHQRQGITTLWKGIGSTLMIRGMALAVEDMISKLTPWPKEVSWHHSLKSIGQHILLKCTTIAIVTPFFSASLVETVQSDIASEKPGIFDVFREGICRLVSWGSPQKGRMLPVWALVLPTVMYGLFKYFFAMLIRGATTRILHSRQKKQQKRKGAVTRDVVDGAALQEIETTSSLIALISADVVLYPFETILHRLHLQGTRTIIDNLDTGYEVIPILTSYEGFWDCYETTLEQEGVSGLYKGFGALVLQFAAHGAVIKLTRLLLTEVTNVFRSNKTIPPSFPADKVEVYPQQPPPPSFSHTQPTYYHYE